jgi:uncharacterized protein (DUF2249 family)
MMNDMDRYAHEIKSHLETLTTNELITMADSMDIFIPPDLERTFIILELLEAGVDLELENSHDPAKLSDQVQEPELASVPKRYNMNYLEVLLRDPLWAFAYWEINSIDRIAYESSPDFKGYVLHVTPLSCKDAPVTTEPFSITVGNTDTSWGIYIQPDIKLFDVKLCADRGETKEVIISSNQIHVPQALDPTDETVRNIPKYPILSLSGIEEFEILRNVDRVARVRRFGES